jgi:hypothetical protein
MSSSLKIWLVLIPLVALCATMAGCGGSSSGPSTAVNRYTIQPIIWLDNQWRKAPLRTDNRDFFTGPPADYNFDIYLNGVNVWGGPDITMTVCRKDGAIISFGNKGSKAWTLAAGDYRVVATLNGKEIAHCWVYVDPSLARG